jgi:hypothetical protein
VAQRLDPRGVVMRPYSDVAELRAALDEARRFMPNARVHAIIPEALGKEAAGLHGCTKQLLPAGSSWVDDLLAAVAGETGLSELKSIHTTELDAKVDANPAAAQEASDGAGALEAGARLNENDASQHAKAIAKTIEFKLAKAFNIERDDPNYQKQVDAFGIKADVIERMIHGSFWSGTRSKLFFLNESQALNQYTSMDCYKFLVRAFGSPVDAKVIESATDAATSAPGMPKGDAKELRKSVADPVGGTILDHLKYWNQRESVEWRTDMFASEARMLLPEDKARIVLIHKPFDVPDC